jgi:hypothetical protein
LLCVHTSLNSNQCSSMDVTAFHLVCEVVEFVVEQMRKPLALLTTISINIVGALQDLGF